MITVNYQGFEKSGSIVELLDDGVPLSILLESVKAKNVKLVRIQHSETLLTLAKHPSSADRATWPMKKEYAEAYHAATSAIPPESVTDENCGLDARQAKNIRLALVDNETIGTYLEKTLARIYAFEEMAFFAEGFKRKTEKAIESTETIEQIEAIMAQASTDMHAAMTHFKAQLNQS